MVFKHSILSLFLVLSILSQKGAGIDLFSYFPHHLLRKGSSESNPDMIPILKGVERYYVEASIISKNGDEVMKPMMLFLHTSETMIAESCEGFLPYDCDQFGCEESLQSKIESHLPYFVVSGFEVKTNIHLRNFWQLKAKGIRSIACYEGLLYSYGTGTYGAIGLGIAGSGSMNYQGLHPIFSIYLKKDGTGGEFWFSLNLEKALSPIPDVVLNATGNWQAYGVEGIQVGKTFIESNYTDGRLIFDLNANTLGIPSHIYWKILKSLEHLGLPLKCWQSDYQNLYRPNCSYSGKLEDLPIIILRVQGKEIHLPLSIYVDSPKNYDPSRGWIILNINAHNNTSHVPETFVTVNYEKTIILDSNFMKYYYTGFDGLNSSILLFTSKEESTSNDPNQDKILLLIEKFAIGFGVLGLAFWIFRKWLPKCCICKSRRNPSPIVQANQVSEPNPDLEGLKNSDHLEEPLMKDVENQFPSPIKNQVPSPRKNHRDIFNVSGPGMNQTVNESRDSSQPQLFQNQQNNTTAARIGDQFTESDLKLNRNVIPELNEEN